jgi:NitT/TauT family transport system ATP-binding protein
MLEFDKVGRDFETPSGAVYCALDDVSFSIAAGAFCAIVGPSGCGKSTLLNVAAGLLAPSRGRVSIDGASLAGLNARATYMFQQDALLPWKDVRENVALGLLLAGSPRPEALDRADGWLRRVGLGGFGRHFPAQLSGGMRKRVAMAQNWVLDRDMVLMDEPFSALDIHTRQRMESELLALWEGRAPGSPASTASRRKTIVFVTHDLEEALALADDVVVLSSGPASRIVARHRVPLDRPRDLLELRTAPAFVDLYRAVWADLREEVIRSQRR